MRPSHSVLRDVQVFVSYSSADRVRANGVADALVALGHEVFIDKQLAAGEGYRGRLEAEIRRSDVVVVLWTKNSIVSSWVKEEAEFARTAGKLLPVRFRVQPPFGFREIHTPDLPLLADGFEVVAALGLGEGMAQPRASGLGRAEPPTEGSPEEWYDRGSVTGRLLKWATRPR